jgi:hypothetical protein
MKKENLITSISILINQISKTEDDSNYFKDKKHDDLVEELKQFLNKNKEFIGNPQLEVLQGLNDHGVDLILKTPDEIKVGFQIKSQFDVSENDFAKKVKSQITESAFHSIVKLYLLICSPYIIEGKIYKHKISHLLSEFSGFKNSYCAAFSPTSCAGLFVKNEKMDDKLFVPIFKQYAVEELNTEELIKEIAPKESKSSFLSRLQEAKSIEFRSAIKFIKYIIDDREFEVDEQELLKEIEVYCKHLEKVPRPSREFFVSVLKFAESYGELGNCINCIKAPYMDIQDSLNIGDQEMIARIKNLQRLNLLDFDEDDAIENGQVVIGIVSGNIHDDLNLSFEIREYFNNNLQDLKTFFVDLDFSGLD